MLVCIALLWRFCMLSPLINPDNSLFLLYIFFLVSREKCSEWVAEVFSRRHLYEVILSAFLGSCSSLLVRWCSNFFFVLFFFFESSLWFFGCWANTLETLPQSRSCKGCHAQMPLRGIWQIRCFGSPTLRCVLYDFSSTAQRAKHSLLLRKWCNAARAQPL